MNVKTIYSSIIEKKLNIDDLIKEFQVSDTIGLSGYLHDLWKELYIYSDDIIKGINYLTFRRVKYNFLFFKVVLSFTWFNFKKIIYFI